jgi:chromosome partitioning protein
MAVFSVASAKGGVGKTTTAVNLAAGLNDDGHQVLLIDLDAQASASRHLGVNPAEARASAVDLLTQRHPLVDVAQETDREGLYLIPGTPDLDEWADRLTPSPANGERLRRAMAPARILCDHVVIDSPPATSLLQTNALTASAWFLVPVVPQFLSLASVEHLLQRVEGLKERHGACADLLGFVVTQADYRTAETEAAVADLRDQYGERVFDAEVRVNVSLAEAPRHGQSIFDYAPQSTGAEAYRSLCREVTARVEEHAASPP